MTKQDRREQAIQEYAKWISRYRWSWFATLKIESGIPTSATAEQRFRKWIGNVEQAHGGEDFRFVRVMERGASGNNLHFHVLVGGLRNRRTDAESQWNRMGGNAQIRIYDPTKNGVLYMLKTMNGSGTLDVDFQLPPASRAMTRASRILATRKRSVPKEELVTIRVANLSPQATVNELWDLFSSCGPVLEIQIIAIANDQASAFIDMDVGGAGEAISRLDARRWNGRQLVVCEAWADV